MNRYLIEVTHDPTHADCGRLADTLTQAGAHFVARAGWGCQSGIHRSWLLVDALTDDDAELIVPPALRKQARIVRLDSASLEDLREIASAARARKDTTMSSQHHSHWPNTRPPYFNPDGIEPAYAKPDTGGVPMWDPETVERQGSPTYQLAANPRRPRETVSAA